MSKLEDLVFTKTPLDAALAAIDCGMWPVPIRADDGKKPLGEDWKRQWTASEIKSAFASRVANGIGLILGPGPDYPIFDVDLDSDQAIDAMADLFGASPDYTLGFRASRGNHWLYQWDDRLQKIDAAVKHWPIGKGVTEQIEIRLGCGKSAQTVIPPTWHKTAGVSRSWLLPGDGNIRISKAPDSVIERLVRDFERKVNFNAIESAVENHRIISASFTGDHPYNRKAVESILSEVSVTQEGGRNDAVYNAAWHIASLMKSQNLDPNPDLAMLGVVSAQIGLSEIEYSQAIRNGWRWGTENPRNPPVLTPVRESETVAVKTKKKGKTKVVAAFSDSALPEEAYTDLKFAEMVIAAFGERFRYIESWKIWASWDGEKGVWVQSQCLHHELFKEFATGDDSYLGSMAKIKSAASMAMSDKRVMAYPDQFDAQVDYLNLKNGVLDLISGQLLEHDPAFMSTKQADVIFDPSARCPKFIATLEQVQPDPEIRLFLQRWLGTVLCGRTLAESVVNYGDGANGKSTILESVGLMMGTYFAKMPRGFIAKTKGDRHPAELVTLYGARFALASETDISDALDESKIKMILGDGSITARRMNENFWSFNPTHKFAIAANHMPSIVGQDSGIWRRLAFVPWTVTIPEEQRQPEYEKVLHQEESSGILNWLLEGYRQHQSLGLAIPDKIKAAGKDVQESSDWLGEFFSENLTTQPKPGYADADRIRASQVYELYKKWAVANGAVVLASNKAIPLFTKRVEQLRATSRRLQNVTWYIGLRIKDESDHQYEADGIVIPAGSPF
jgi:P4 family phage/plasmid primase-like protien